MHLQDITKYEMSVFSLLTLQHEDQASIIHKEFVKGIHPVDAFAHSVAVNGWPLSRSTVLMGRLGVDKGAGEKHGS